jgi:circadian clock protein KaiC
MRPKDLMIQAASINFDLENYMNQNSVIVVRVSPPTELYQEANPDEFLSEYMDDIGAIVQQYKPSKIIFDELTPFVGYKNLNILQTVFLNTTDLIEETGITSLFVLGEPVSPDTNRIVDKLASFATGVISLQKEESLPGRFQSGKIVITPNIGHAEGQFKSEYFIVPQKGVTTSPSVEKIKETEPKQYEADEKYKKLTEIDLTDDNYSFLNLYSVNDFKLLLNNQIALYKSTGQTFTVISFRLDTIAEQKGLLSVNQLQNVIRLSIEKKDKICVLGNKVIVLVIQGDPKALNRVVSRIKSNLPLKSKDLINQILPLISVYSVKVDDSITGAEDIFNLLVSERSVERKNLDYY